MNGRWVPCVLSMMLLGCNDQDRAAALRVRSESIVFGSDDRLEPFQLPNQAEAERLANAEVALVPAARLDSSDPVGLQAPTLAERFSVCPDERFAGQLTAADCSGTLVAPDLVLTAGHCISDETCPSTRLVFGYAMQTEAQLRTLPRADVFACQEIVARSFAGALDYAFVRLDRAAAGHEPLPLRLGRRPVPEGTELRVFGHPSGLPLKLAAGGFVSNARSAELDYFIANLDSFPGNSGSGLVAAAGGPLLGMVTQGPSGSYIFDPEAGCQRTEVVANDAPSQIISVYLQPALAELCNEHAEPWLCSCGNGSCEPERGEDTTACPADCGSACGDGSCTGSETPNTCYADCAACGNGSCEQHEIARLSCCAECGCPTGFRCDGQSCAPELGNVNGDTTVDDADAALIASLARGWPIATLSRRAADVDCDGTITPQDARRVFEKSRGAPEPLPCQRLRDVALGNQHTCVLQAAGVVSCWGSDVFGQLGEGAGPARASGASAAQATAVPLGGKATAVVAGAFHSCALLEDGGVRCWGSGAFGQLGGGNRDNVGDDEAPSARPELPLSERAVQLTAGANHSCALLESGRVRCWGDNTFGQLGLGHRRALGDDEQLDGLPAVELPGRAVQVVAGQQHTCALLADGRVSCWGGNAFGQLGLALVGNVGDDELPSSVGTLDLGGVARALRAGTRHNCALLTDGSARCWGDNSFGQLGYGHTQRIGDDETPATAGALDLGGNVVSLALGDARSCALYDDGSVRCWGNNARGQLGYGDVLLRGAAVVPAALPTLELATKSERIFAQAQQTCALASDGSLRCWGDNGSGQLGYSQRSNVGDDETPATKGPVPLLAAQDAGWTFRNASQLRVWRSVRAGQALELRFFLENRGEQAVSDVRLLLPVRVSVAAQLLDKGTPWSSPALAFEARGNATLMLDFSDRVLAAHALSSHGPLAGEHVQLMVSDGSELSAEYALSDSLAPLYWPTERAQLVDRNDNVVLGWSREPSSP